MKTIVVAWTDFTGLRPTGEMERFDGVNWRPKFEVCEEAKACVWLNKGTDEDFVKAVAYCAKEHADKPKNQVFAFPIKEKDPLGKAKRMIMK